MGPLGPQRLSTDDHPMFTIRCQRGCEPRSVHASVSELRIVRTSVEEFEAGCGTRFFRNDGRAFASDVRFADTFAKGEVSQEIVAAIRMTALRKLDSGVRGIVVGNLFRRQVSRSLAKQFAQQVEDVTAPFQCASKTRAGCECVAHIFQSFNEVEPSTTVILVDGGAFDLVSRAAMVSGLFDMEEGERLLPFVWTFYF